MGVRSARWRWLAVASAFLTLSCAPAGLQRQDQFEWAIKAGSGSTSPPIVRVRLLNTPSDAGSIRCVFSDTLIDAIMLERGLPATKTGYKMAVSVALASRDHNFRFVQAAARNVITARRGMMEARLSKGCKLIEQGKSALWADTQGTVVEGPRFPLANGTR